MAVGSSLVVAFLIPILNFVSLFPLVSQLPKWDAWTRVPVWNAYFHHLPVMPLFLKPYNGHVLTLPNLFFFALGRLSSWNLRVEAFCNYLFALGSLGAYLWLFGKLDRRLLVFAAPIAVYIFSILQVESFVSSEAVVGHMQVCASTWALALLVAPHFSQSRFWLALLLAIAGSVSYATGMVIWPLGLLALLVRPMGISRVGLWLIAGLMCVGAEANAALAVVPHGLGSTFLEFSKFFLVLLGRPFVWLPTTSPWLTGLLGVLFIALFGALVVVEWRLKSSHQILGVCAVISLFAVGQAAMIALGRARLGVHLATFSHYVTATYPLAIAMVVLAGSAGVSILGRAKNRAQRRAAVAWVSFWTLLPLAQNTLFAQAHLPNIRRWAELWFKTDGDLTAGIATDDEIRQTQHHNTVLVREGLETLSRYNLAAFAGRATRFPEGSVDQIAGLSAANESLVIDPNSGWNVQGWAADTKKVGGEVHAIELYLDSRRIGSSTLGLPRPDVARYFRSDRFQGTGWRIDVPAGSAGEPGMKSIRVVARNHSNIAITLLNRAVTVR
jgi:hypothetical protein